jgi:hypothetical protein
VVKGSLALGLPGYGLKQGERMYKTLGKTHDGTGDSLVTIVEDIVLMASGFRLLDRSADFCH